MTAFRSHPSSEDFQAFWSDSCGVVTIMSKDGTLIVGEVAHVYDRSEVRAACERVLADLAQNIEIKEA